MPAQAGSLDYRGHARELVGKRALIGAAGRATWGQLRNSPHEWGGGVGGFTKRFASSLGQHAIKYGIQSGVAGIRHENLHYQRSNLQGTWPRMKYAVKSTFIVPRTNRPGKTVAMGRISGNLGAGMISRAWQPASTAGLGAGLASGGIGLGADVGVHVAREFWPRKKSAGQAAKKR
jgi:hypothetical protein